MTTQPSPLTRDDVRAIVSEEVEKFAELIGFIPGIEGGESTLKGGSPDLDVAKSYNQVWQEQLRKRRIRTLTYQFKESSPESEHGGGLAGDGPLVDDVSQAAFQIAHDSSPSVDGVDAHSVGDVQAAGGVSDSSAAGQIHSED